MNSRAWTEVATGAEVGRGRPWVRRVALPILARYLLLLVMLVLAVLAFGLLLSPARGGHCGICEQPVPQREDLLGMIF
jgi:hypothetical protein